MVSSSIQRKALDPTGALGLHYDANQNSVVKRTHRLGSEHAVVEMKRSIRCAFIKGGTEQSQNLLQMISIDLDSRLNIRLKNRLNTGIASIIDYPYLTNNHTRYVHLTYFDREQKLSDNTQIKEKLKSSTRDANSTHVITSIRFGLDVVIVIQLTNQDGIISEMDAALERLRDRLESLNDSLTLSDIDQNILNQINETRGYSNVPELCTDLSLSQMCQRISKCRREPSMCLPLVYTLEPIEWLYPTTDQHEGYKPLDGQEYHELEQYLIQLSRTIKQEHRSSFTDSPKQLQRLKDAYENDIEDFRNLVDDIRSGRRRVVDLNQKLRAAEQMRQLQSKDDGLNRGIIDGKRKETFIRGLIKDHFEYCNVVEDYPHSDSDEQMVKAKLQMDNRYDWIFCSNDAFKTNHFDAWNNFKTELLEKKKDDPSVRLLYADFTYCSFPSETTVIQVSNEVINILLVGESGVGKSTFINAFVNYLKYRTFEEAQSSTPTVLIPVSFLITTGDNFDECIVKFGDVDAQNNEDFDHPGQSVTQQCRSYPFELRRNDGRKVRIIDTPGFEDTRGVDQDDRNLQYVLEYIKKLPFLHSICFLLKPDASNISNYLTACLQKILDVFDEKMRRNIIFCFTNTRPTFYSPGSTSSLLRQILQSKPMRDVPFKKENTFCFDNESFRYLVALQNDVKFDDRDKEDYQMSWSKSVDESNRFYDYICKELKACAVRIDQPSNKRAQIETP